MSSTYFPMQVAVIGPIDHNPVPFQPIVLRFSKDIVLSKHQCSSTDQIEFQTASQTVCSAFGQCSSQIEAEMALQIGQIAKLYISLQKYCFYFKVKIFPKKLPLSWNRLELKPP